MINLSLNPTKFLKPEKKLKGCIFLLAFSLIFAGCSKRILDCPADTSLDSCLLKNKFNGIIFVQKNGNKVLEKAYGKASENELNNLTHRFRIGSVSKIVTSAAIQLLIKDGLIQPGDKIDK